LSRLDVRLIVLGLLVTVAPWDLKEDGRVGSGFFDDESLGF